MSHDKARRAGTQYQPVDNFGPRDPRETLTSRRVALHPIPQAAEPAQYLRRNAPRNRLRRAAAANSAPANGMKITNAPSTSRKTRARTSATASAPMANPNGPPWAP